MHTALNGRLAEKAPAKLEVNKGLASTSQSCHFQLGLVIWCMVLALAAFILTSSNGWRAGFLMSQAIGNQFPSWLWEALNTLGDERMLLALLLPFSMRYPNVFWAVVVASVIGALVAKGLKFALPMPRPAEVIDAAQLTIIGARRTGHSFPSSHATSIFAFAMVCIAHLRLRAALPILGLAVLASFSRVAAGAHWPIDVMAGAIIGSLAAGAGLILARHSSWGCHPKFHWALVTLVAIAICSLPFDNQGFPGSLVFRCAVCAFGLSAYWLHYLGPSINTAWMIATIRTKQV